MKKVVVYFAVIFIASVIYSCRKDTSEARTATIKGNVLNLCTNKILSGIQVSLVIHNPKSNSTTSVSSDAGGNFSFDNVSFNMSSDYSYHLYIESKSGIGSGPEIGFDGVDIIVDKNDLGHFFSLGVVPHFKLWYFYFPAGSPVSTSDTISLTLQQNTFKANVPENPNYKLILINSPAYPAPSNNYIGVSGNYWMGWWYSTLDRIKNGVRTIKTDSFYIDWGATKTDTITY